MDKKKLKQTLQDFKNQNKIIVDNTKEVIMSNLAMVNQIPALTFKEEKRANYILEKFKEQDFLETYLDEEGNVHSTYLKKNEGNTVLLFSHIDTNFDDYIDHNVTFNRKTIAGAGVDDNSLGIAVLLSLPEILKKLKETINLNFIFLATTKSQGKGDFKGIRHFIKKNAKTIDTCINLMGVTIGRIDHFTLSRIRCDINCFISEISPTDSLSENLNDAIYVINDLISLILKIPIPNKPKTKINIGKISGGESYSKPSQKASLSLQIISEEDNMVKDLVEQVNDLCIYTSSKYGIKLNTLFFGRQNAAALNFNHPLVKTAYEVVNLLGYLPIMIPSNTEITVPLASDIPSITIGITTGENNRLPESSINTTPITNGVMQILMILHAIEKGFCDEQ